MSEFTLTVGECYEQRRSERCMTHLQSLGISADPTFFRPHASNPHRTYLLLNDATVGTFLDYVARLAGRPGNQLMNDPAFNNLPYWQDTLWIPFDFAHATAFVDDPDGPFFFGSSPRLLATLNAIKSSSQIPLGPAPAGYDLMISDERAFYKGFRGLQDDPSCIQWVWRGLHDAATLAVGNKLPMLGNGL